jgi:hypothetical protein
MPDRLHEHYYHTIYQYDLLAISCVCVVYAYLRLHFTIMTQGSEKIAFFIALIFQDLA